MTVVQIKPYSIVYYINDGSDGHKVWLSVQKDWYCEIDRAYGFENKYRPGPFKGDDKEQWDARQEIWDWLTDLEIVSLRPIGPEDSEYFANMDRIKDVTDV